MTDLLELKPDDAVLEIGTGLGYQAAVLAELASRVYSVEIIDELAQRAIRRLKQQGYTNVEVRTANGYAGWPEHPPFDKMIVTAAPDLIPPPLINQLKAGARMVIPVGLLGAQQLVIVKKDFNGKVTCQATAYSPGSRNALGCDQIQDQIDRLDGCLPENGQPALTRDSKSDCFGSYQPFADFNANVPCLSICLTFEF